MVKQNKHESEIDGPPPIMTTWYRLYALVLILHIGLIVGFYLVTVAYK